MGRRVTSTTKGGRYMNPADQERKVIRRKELKKNKKQRQLVRQAVLKSKDPSQLIEEMEKLDHMQFNPHEEAPISERVIQDKRNKLRETYIRVMSMYKHENNMEKYAEVRKNLNEYDRRKTQLEQHYIAVKFARDVDPGEIPLPDAAPPLPGSIPLPLMGGHPQGFALPPFGAAGGPPVLHLQHHHLHGTGAGPGPVVQQQQSPFPIHFMLPDAPGMVLGPKGPLGTAPPKPILKKQQLQQRQQKPAGPPGLPAGPPPDLSDDEDHEHYDDEEEERAPGAKQAPSKVLLEEGEASTDESGLESDESVDGGVKGHSSDNDSLDGEMMDKPKKKKKVKVRFDAAGAVDEDKDSRTKYKKLAKKLAMGEKLTEEEQQLDAAAKANHLQQQFAQLSAAFPPTSAIPGAPTPTSNRFIGPTMPPNLAAGGPPPRLGFMPGGPMGPPRMHPPMPPGMRMVPPPPSLMKANFQQRPFIGPGHPSSSSSSTDSSVVISAGPVLSAPPAIHKLQPKITANSGSTKSTTQQQQQQQQQPSTIEAKPQLRSIQRDATKFVPTGVKIKLERSGGALPPSSTNNVGASKAQSEQHHHHENVPKSKGPIAFRVQASNAAQAAQRAKAKTTDDAYDEFMNEMKDLL